MTVDGPMQAERKVKDPAASARLHEITAELNKTDAAIRDAFRKREELVREALDCLTDIGQMQRRFEQSRDFVGDRGANEPHNAVYDQRSPEKIA